MHNFNNSVPNLFDRLTGFTRHGINQILGRDGGRGVNNAALKDAIKNPTRVACQVPINNPNDKRLRFIFKGRKATAVLNEFGKLITAFGKAR